MLGWHFAENSEDNQGSHSLDVQEVLWVSDFWVFIKLCTIKRL